MKPLQTARVCVIDDEPKEYLKLIHALSQIGLGCLHIDGTKFEELPTTPVKGLRLVFVDMHLGTAGDAVQIAAHTANVFARVVAQDGGPVVVVFWTKHADYVDAFKESLFGRWNGFLGRVVFSRMNKPGASEEIELDKLTQELKTILDGHHPLQLVWEWEQAAHDAATETTAVVAQLAAGRAQFTASDTEPQMAEKVRASYEVLLRLLLDAAAGLSGAKESAVRDLHSALHALHSDRLEHASLSTGQSKAPDLLEIQKQMPNPAERLAINSMLHFAPVDADAEHLGPGSLYTFTDFDQFKSSFGQEWNTVAATVLDPSGFKQEEIPGLVAKFCPVMIEVSGDCDYAQRKRPVAKLILGVLLPLDICTDLEKKKKLRRADYCRHCLDLKLSVPEGDWRPVFISQFVFSISPAKRPKLLQPIGRLRSGPLAELRHWLTSHGARPGFLRV